MYTLALVLHSAVRWLVVALALLVVVRATRAARRRAPWTANDARLARALLAVVNVQFLLGLLLYVFLSPVVRAAFSELGAAMRSHTLRFFVVEHITAMLIAVALIHLGIARARRADDDTKRHRTVRNFVAAGLVALVIGMPWPFRPYGRPLLRASVASDGASATDTPAVYLRRCAVCHGARGRGDGLAGAAMQPAPRDFCQRGFQQSVSDDDLRRAIRAGGSARGLSTNMPAHPDLAPRELDALVAYIRRTCR